MDHSLVAAAPVERLAAVVPSPVSLVAVGSDIEVSAGQGRYGQVTMDLSAFGPLRGHITENEFLRAACCHVLDAVQDYVAEATTEPSAIPSGRRAGSDALFVPSCLCC